MRCVWIPPRPANRAVLIKLSPPQSPHSTSVARQRGSVLGQRNTTVKMSSYFNTPHPMRVLSVFFLSAFVLARTAFGQATCHTADEHSATVIYQITRLMDSNQAQARLEFGVPLVAPSEITLVADSATCARAGQAVDSLLYVWHPTATIPPWQAPLYVFKIGTSYAAMDRSTPNAPAYRVLFFTAVWAHTVALRM